MATKNYNIYDKYLVETVGPGWLAMARVALRRAGAKQAELA
jgi:hypothetical protein